MRIPRAWSKAEDEVEARGKRLHLVAWGWGDDVAAAGRLAAERLARLVERVRRGERFPDLYGYGLERPLREEVVQTIGDAGVVTRNVYGALVLNTARLLFIDVDLPEGGPSLGQRVLGLFGRRPPDPLERLREALRAVAPLTFRIYRTAAGLRALGVDRQYEPGGQAAEALMTHAGADPRYVKLCRAQKSFRARLTPKPWRCGAPPRPPGEHPRTDPDLQARFDGWLREYEAASAGWATCEYVETIGAGHPDEHAAGLIALHDRVTRAGERLPLA